MDMILFMTKKNRVTLADIAAACGVSKMSVSLALRNHPGVSEKTRALITQKAEELGYRPDPVLAALHRYSQNARSHEIRSTIAWLNTWTKPEQLRQHKEFDLYWSGAKEHAETLGYRLEEFRISEYPPARLDAIFKTRHIQGLLVPPQQNACSELEQFNWADYAIVRLGQSAALPKTHFVASAQVQNTIRVFDYAQQLGYQRIGFIGGFNYTRYFTAGYLWSQHKLPTSQQVPLLQMAPPYDTHQKLDQVNGWIAKHRPDAIITDKGKIPEMVHALGFRVPEDIAIATTSIHDTPINAGIDQRPGKIGRAAIRLLHALIIEQAFGIPDHCDELLIEGEWVDGSMMPRRDA